MNKINLISEVDDYAERLIAAGDIDSFERVFETRDCSNFSVFSLTQDQLQEIYNEYIKE